MADSLVHMVELVFPNDANALGSAMGGRVLHWIDVAGAIACLRHCGRVVVTASMDSVDFLYPIRVAQLAVLEARLNWAGHTSMEVEVQVFAEDPVAHTRQLTTRAYLTFVALDEEGRPAPVPPLELVDEAERRRFREAAARQEQRLARRSPPRGPADPPPPPGSAPPVP